MCICAYLPPLFCRGRRREVHYTGSEKLTASVSSGHHRTARGPIGRLVEFSFSVLRGACDDRIPSFPADVQLSARRHFLPSRILLTVGRPIAATRRDCCAQLQLRPCRTIRRSLFLPPVSAQSFHVGDMKDMPATHRIPRSCVALSAFYISCVYSRCILARRRTLRADL